MPPEPAPVPIAATINGFGFLQIVFDRPLQPGVVQGANWFARRANVARLFFPDPSAAGAAVSGSAPVSGADIGPDIVSYSAAVPDVIGANGVPVAAFTDFPLTFVP